MESQSLRRREHNSNWNEERDNTSKQTTPEKLELLYDGVYHDVTHWARKHPGGGIINLYTGKGEDATIVIQQFHHRAFGKIVAILKSLPRRNPTQDDYTLSPETVSRHNELTEGFQKLTAEMISEGFFDPNPSRFAKRIIHILIMIAIGLAVSFFLGQVSITWRVLSVLIMTLAGGQALWLGHEGGHNAFTGVRKYDRIVQIITYGFMFGLSASSWNKTHAEHHSKPQHVDHDADLKTLPILAFNKKLVKSPSMAKSFWLRNQKWLFVLCDTCIITLTWKFNHHIKFCIQNEKWFDLICMACHYSLVPLLGFFEWLAITWLGSIYVLGNLILSHTHLPIVEEGNQLHWVEYAFYHTTNIRSSWWVDWWTGHLNYQIEHHLFPTMPQYKNKLCSDKVKAFATKYNLPYHLCSYWDALKNTYCNLDKVSKDISSLM